MSASSKNTATKVPLRVKAADAATEIFLVDAHFNRLDKAVGELLTAVTPGIYKLRFRSAQTQTDILTEVPPAGIPPIAGPLVPFVTAMPLDNTAFPNPDHQQLVKDTTVNPAQKALGAGSRLSVFVRDCTGLSSEQPWSGLDIHRLDGSLLTDVSDSQQAPSKGIAALSLDLDPGTYRVRVSPVNAPAHEFFVSLAKDWQTQVFTFSGEPSGPADRLRTPRLTDASLRMARLGTAFNPGDPQLRLAELLRYGLESGRSILTDTAVSEVLNSDGSNPMLDIFTGHLLIRERPIKHPTVEQLISRVSQAIGELPDITALKLRPGTGTPPRELIFETPPLLRSSWNLIVAASRRRMSLVPPNSLTAQVGEGLLTHPLWLLNGHLDLIPKPAQEAMSFAEASRILNRWIEINPDRLDEKSLSDIKQVMAEASPLEQSLLNATLFHRESPQAESKDRLTYSVSQALNQIRVPRYSVIRSAQRLKEKLGL